MMSSGAPQKLDLYLEGLAAFQEGASSLKAGDPLCLQQQEGGRLACMTRSGTAVGLVPADKRALLSRGPWSGTVRSVKRSSSAAAVKAATDAGLAAPSQAAPAAEVLHAVGAGPADGEGEQHRAAAPASKPQLITQQQQELKQPASQGHHSQAAEQGQPQAQLVIQQVLVRFTPEEQSWQPRRDEAPPEQPQEEDTARLSQEQYEMLAASEDVRWMLRDERLQKVVTDIDAAPDRESALVRALQAPNFMEFADQVLGVIAHEGPH